MIFWALFSQDGKCDLLSSLEAVFMPEMASAIAMNRQTELNVGKCQNGPGVNAEKGLLYQVRYVVLNAYVPIGIDSVGKRLIFPYSKRNNVVKICPR